MVPGKVCRCRVSREFGLLTLRIGVVGLSGLFEIEV